MFYGLPPDRGHPLQAWASRFGFGAATGIDIGPEGRACCRRPSGARRPTRRRRDPRSWQIDRLWKPGDSIQLAIGQKDLLVTPLQMARFYALIANGGKLVTPHVVVDAEQPGQNGAPPSCSAASRRPRRSRPASIRPRSQVVRDGLYQATHALVRHLDAASSAATRSRSRARPARRRSRQPPGYRSRMLQTSPGGAATGRATTPKIVVCARDRERRPRRRRGRARGAEGLRAVLPRQEAAPIPTGHDRLMVELAGPGRPRAARGAPAAPRRPRSCAALDWVLLARGRGLVALRPLGDRGHHARRRRRQPELLRLPAARLRRRSARSASSRCSASTPTSTGGSSGRSTSGRSALMVFVFVAGTVARAARSAGSTSASSSSSRPSSASSLFVLFLAGFLADRSQERGRATRTSLTRSASRVAADPARLRPAGHRHRARLRRRARRRCCSSPARAGSTSPCSRSSRSSRARAPVAGCPRPGVQVLKPYQAAPPHRLHPPDQDPRGSTYNVNQSITAVGAGGLERARASPAPPRRSLDYLPEHATDFVVRLARRAARLRRRGDSCSCSTCSSSGAGRSRRDRPGRVLAIVAGGIVFAFLFQIFVNVGMTIGIAPITGIPLAVRQRRRLVDDREPARDRRALRRSMPAAARARGARWWEASWPTPRRRDGASPACCATSAPRERPPAARRSRAPALSPRSLRKELARGGARPPSGVGGTAKEAAALVYVLAAAADGGRRAAAAARRRGRVFRWSPSCRRAPTRDSRAVRPRTRTSFASLQGAGFPVDEIAQAARRAGSASRATPLAARLPALRDAVCEELIRTFSRQNGLPRGRGLRPRRRPAGPDRQPGPARAPDRRRLRLRIDRDRLPEVLAVIGIGLRLPGAGQEGDRVRSLVGLGGQGRVAYAATRALGEAAVRYFEAAGAGDQGRGRARAVSVEASVRRGP